jgi:hypothetical protein
MRTGTKSLGNLKHRFAWSILDAYLKAAISAEQRHVLPWIQAAQRLNLTEH